MGGELVPVVSPNDRSNSPARQIDCSGRADLKIVNRGMARVTAAIRALAPTSVSHGT